MDRSKDLPVSASTGAGPCADETVAASESAAGDSDAPLTIDRFTLIRAIGHGGMGDVFLANHPITGLEVAVKRLKPSLVPERQHVQRFLTEARHMYHLNHPHILRIMEVWDPPAGPYYVMPYMDCGSLANQIRRGQPTDYVLTLRVARDIAEALAYAHSKGIIHRDLKPLNVLMDGEGRAFLSDFGLVRAFNTHDPDLDVRNQSAEGTAPYMSPAVAKGEAEDTRCDIYSFGALLYELLTGELPYEGSSSSEVVEKILAGPPVAILKRNPHAPAGLAQIAGGAMARELRDRYSSMADVLADLERWNNGKLPLGRHGRDSKKASGKWIAATVLPLIVGGFAVARWRPSRSASVHPAIAPHSAIQTVAVLDGAKIRVHLLEAIEQTHDRELVEAAKAADWRERNRLKDASDAEYDAKAAKIDELVGSFKEIEGRADATDIFKEMSRILSSQGVDETIAYVNSQKDGILKRLQKRAASQRERNRAELQPLLKEASLYESKGKPLEAGELYDQILSMEPQWPAALDSVFGFDIRQGNIGIVKSMQTEARRWFDHARKTADSLMALDGGSPDSREKLSIAYRRLGDVAVNQGKLDEAAQILGNALAMQRKLAAGDPGNTNWQGELSVTYYRLGDVLWIRGKLESAAQCYNESLAIRKRLAASDPGSVTREYLSILYGRLGDIAMRQGKMDEAAKLYADEFDVNVKLASSDPGNVEWQLKLSMSYVQLGDVAFKQARFDAAARLDGNALAIQTRLAARDPRNSEWQRDLSVSYGQLGDVALKQGELDDASRLFGEQFSITRKLAASDPGNPWFQRDLSYAYLNLGGLAAKQAKPDDAVRLCGESLTIRKALALADPRNAWFQSELADSYNGLGEAAVGQGKLDDAARFFRSSLAIRKDQASTNAANAESQRDLWMSYKNIADLAERLRDTAGAQEAWREALRILQGMRDQDMFISPEDLKDLETIRRNAKEPATQPGGERRGGDEEK